MRIEADAGELDRARAVCEAAIASTPTAGLLSLLGVIHLAAGRAGDDLRAGDVVGDPDAVDGLARVVAGVGMLGDAPQGVARVHAVVARRRCARISSNCRSSAGATLSCAIFAACAP